MTLIAELPEDPKRDYLIHMTDDRVIVIRSSSDPTSHPSLHGRVRSVIILDTSNISDIE